MSKDLEHEIELLKQRNAQVDANKKWERNPIRIILIALMTYGIVLLYSFLVDTKTSVFLSSTVPVIGFFVSTLSLNFIRKITQKKRESLLQKRGPRLAKEN